MELVEFIHGKKLARIDPELRPHELRERTTPSKKHPMLKLHQPRPATCTPFCLQGLFLFRSLSTDPRTLLCKRRIEDFHRAKIVKFVSFTGAFTGKYVVKSVKEACETVHSNPKETCQFTTQFNQPFKTACFWWVKERTKDAQQCDLELCKFVGYFNVFSSSYAGRRTDF